MARVVIENLSKTFKGAKDEEILAVNNASLTIEDQEFLVLVGPSGAGKSTTLRMIAGLEDISKGTVAIDGMVVNAVPPKDRDLAMVFQNYALYPHMTVFENLAFGLKLRKFPRAEINQRVQETAEMLGLKPLLDRKPSALSGGERQRVALGRAIARRPKVFLFDEPLSNLDAPMRAQLRAEISRLHRRLETTMIYVTHDQVEAMTLGDRIAVMKEGVIQQVAAPMTLYNSPSNLFVAGFIGAPPMNFFQGSILQKGTELFFADQARGGGSGSGNFVVRIPGGPASPLSNWVGKKLILGLRPESVGVRGWVGFAPAPPGMVSAHLDPGAGSPGGRQDACPTIAESVVATVEAIQPLGAEMHLHLSTGSHSFIAIAPTERRSELNLKQSIPMVFDMSKAHFFEPDTELAISWRKC